MTTLKDFRKAIKTAPYDWDLRLVFSDFLEENGDLVRANGQRWQVENEKAATFNNHGFYKWRALCESTCGGHKEDLLWLDLFHELRNFDRYQILVSLYKSRASSEDALAYGLTKWRK